MRGTTFFGVLSNGEVEGPPRSATQAPRAHTLFSRPRRVTTHVHGPLQRLLERGSLVRFHVCSQQCVHPGLIPSTLLPEPLDNVGVDAKGQQRLLWNRL